MEQKRNDSEEFDKLFPVDLDEFDKQRIKARQLRERKSKGAKIEDPYLLKKRAYELIVQGYSSKTYVPLLAEEFGVADSTISAHIKNLRLEVREQYEEVYSILRESIVMDLINMKNGSKTVHEKIKCIELIVKITGLSQEVVINHTQDSRTFIISPIEENKKIGE